MRRLQVPKTSGLFSKNVLQPEAGRTMLLLWCVVSKRICGSVVQKIWHIRPVTSLRHQRREGFSEGPKFFELCPTNFSKEAKNFAGAERSPPGYGPVTYWKPWQKSNRHSFCRSLRSTNRTKKRAKETDNLNIGVTVDCIALNCWGMHKRNMTIRGIN